MFTLRVVVLQITLLAATALLGCSTMPVSSGPLPYIELPVRWQGTPIEQATKLSKWWLRFEDPLLGELVNDALLANTSIGSARATMRKARALRDVAASALYPTLAARFSAQRSVSDDVASNSFSTGLDASWEMDWFGANRDAVRSAEASTSASAALLGEIQVSVAAEVALTYITLRSAQERLEIARSNFASQLDTLQIAEWRLEAGLVTSLETEQSRAAVEQTRASIPPLHVSIAQSSHALAVLTARTPDALTLDLSEVQLVPQPITDIALSFPAETLRQRADVRAAEYQVDAAAALASQADAASLPGFRLSGSLGLGALSLAGLTNGANVLGSVLANATLPIFDGGANDAQYRVQRAALEQVQISYKASVLNAMKEVEDALVALRADRLRLASLRVAADSATNASLMATQRYQSGLVDFQVVLETQRTRLSTQDSVAAAYATVSADHVRLYKALGGGWQNDNRHSTL